MQKGAKNKVFDFFSILVGSIGLIFHFVKVLNIFQQSSAVFKTMSTGLKESFVDILVHGRRESLAGGRNIVSLESFWSSCRRCCCSPCGHLLFHKITDWYQNTLFLTLIGVGILHCIITSIITTNAILLVHLRTVKGTNNLQTFLQQIFLSRIIISNCDDP